MCPPTATSLADIGSHCTHEELFMYIKRMIDGSPLPGNVIIDVNPYHYMPSNLPGGIWYFICSEEKRDTDFGFWQSKGEACRIFSNSVIIGWRTTLEFYEGKAPHDLKTDWVMQEYWITQKGQCESSNAKKFNSLCRIFLSDKQNSSSEMQADLSADNSASETHIQSTESCVPKVDNDIGRGTIHKPQVHNNDTETGPLSPTEIYPNHPVEYLPEIDYLSRGDYLELLDLDNPESPSSCSENSSFLTDSSDECFDSLTLLQDLEPENNQDLTQKDGGCKFSISISHRPNEMVMCPATSVSLRSIERSKPPNEESPNIDCFMPGVADEDIDNKSSNHAIIDPKSDCRSAGPSSSCHLPDPNGEKKVAVSRMKKLKNYLCFMPN